MENQYKDLEDKLKRVRIILLQNHFFLGSFLVNLPTYIDPSVKTAETNGEYIKYNPKFIKDLTEQELLFLYAHEVMHVVLEHTLRFGNRNEAIWQTACDVVVNQLLIQDKIGTFIKGGINEPKLYAQGKGQTERIYDLLMQQNPPPPPITLNTNFGNGDENDDGNSNEATINIKGKSLDQLIPQEGTPQEIKEKVEALRNKVATALATAKICGNTPKGIERYVEHSLYTKPTCLEVLQDYMVKLKSTTRTYSRPSRRFISRNIYLPSTPPEDAVGHIAVCCDTSGSITTKELQYFKGLLEMCRSIYKPALMTISYFDYVVHSTDVFEPHDELRVLIKGNGGTSYHDIWDKIETPPDVCLVLSDMKCKSWGKKPDYPVVWLSTGKIVKVPFGKIIDFYSR